MYIANYYPAVGRFLREPTLHFILLAAALFGINAVVGSCSREVIQIDRAAVAARIFLNEMNLGAPLNEDQRHQVEESYVDEQVLVQEALELGLERDVRIHDILAQKMRHVLSGELIQPTDQELQNYYEVNQTRYVQEASLTVNELVVRSPDPLPEALAEQLQGGVWADQLVSELAGSRGVLERVSRSDLAAMFNAEVAGRIFEAGPGQWIGPHRSVRGQHWLQVEVRAEEALPPLEVLYDRVRIDWIAAEEEERLARRVAELRARYDIVYTGEVVEP